MAGFSRGESDQDFICTGETLALRLLESLVMDPDDRPPIEIYVDGGRYLITGYKIDTVFSEEAGKDMLSVDCTIRRPSLTPDRTDRVMLQFSATDTELTESNIIYDECE